LIIVPGGIFRVSMLSTRCVFDSSHTTTPREAGSRVLHDRSSKSSPARKVGSGFPLPMRFYIGSTWLTCKNRQKQTADICKQHLREKYQDELGLVEEFIVEFEGARKNRDVTRWGLFTDVKDIKEEMLKRLEAHFEKWLNP
jgi:hypothetical protein